MHGQLHLRKKETGSFRADQTDEEKEKEKEKEKVRLGMEMEMEMSWSDLFGVVLFGGFGGVCAEFWKFEHNWHHLVVNAHNEQMQDPQGYLPLWCQDPQLQSGLQEKHGFDVKQQMVNYGVMYCFGRLVLMYRYWIGSIITWVTGAHADTGDDMSHMADKGASCASVCVSSLHMMCVVYLHCLIPTWTERLLFVQVTNMIFGCLVGTPVLLNHLTRPWMSSEQSYSYPWLVVQTASTVDISGIVGQWCPWLFGIMSEHVVHHVFPRLPRPHFQYASEELRRICEQYDVVWDKSSLLELNVLAFRRLWHIQQRLLAKPPSPLPQQRSEKKKEKPVQSKQQKKSEDM